MAYISQEKKAAIVAKAKPILKKYGVKATFSVDHYSTLKLNIKESPLDFIGNYNETAQARPYGLPSYWTPASNDMTIHPTHVADNFTGDVLRFLEEIVPVLMEGNHDNSDSQSDYFDVGWYVYVNVGRWNKPYVCTKAA